MRNETAVGIGVELSGVTLGLLVSIVAPDVPAAVSVTIIAVFGMTGILLIVYGLRTSPSKGSEIHQLWLPPTSPKAERRDDSPSTFSGDHLWGLAWFAFLSLIVGTPVFGILSIFVSGWFLWAYLAAMSFGTVGLIGTVAYMQAKSGHP